MISVKDQKRAQEHELKGKMAEVNIQLLMISKGEETDHRFIDAGTRIKQVEGAIKEEMKERSCEARSDAFTTQMSTKHYISIFILG